MLCAPREVLEQFADGILPTETAAAIELHVETCADCQATLDQLTDETGLETLFDDPGGLTPPRRTAAPPVRVPGYEVGAEVGRGGHGVVYQATDTALARRVALKVLRHGAFSTAAERERFVAEARAVARIHHPNVLGVLAAGEADGLPYLVTEWVEGGPLSARLDGTPLPEREAARLIATLARAAHHAHVAGVIHRDIKPSNVLLNGSDLTSPKLADFGLAKLGDAGGGLTPTSAVMGTPSYMAPEQAGGESCRVGPAADVYSLGAVLYELLTGRPPFKAATPFETILQVRNQDPIRPRDFRPGVSRDLETVCLRCLEKRPAARYTTATALAEDLDRFLAGRPVAARPVGPAARLGRWIRRHPGTAGLVGLLVTFVAASLFALTSLWRRAEANANRATTGATDADRSRVEARKALVLYAATSRRLFRSPESVTPSERAALISSVQRAETVLSAPTGDPDEEHDAAFALLQLADSLHSLHENTAAVSPCRTGVAVLKRLAEERPDRNRFVFHYSQGCSQLAGTLEAAGSRAETDGLLGEAVRAAEVVRGRLPNEPEVQSALADYRRKYAARLLRRGDLDEAWQTLAPAVVAARALTESDPESAIWYLYRAGIESDRALISFFREHSADGYRELAAERLAAFHRSKRLHGRPDWTNALRAMLSNHHSVAALDEIGRPAEATAVLEAAVAAATELFELEPSSPGVATEYALLLESDGRRRWPTDPAGARTRFQKAVTLLEQASGFRGAGGCYLAHLLATCPDPSLRDTRRAVSLARESAGPAHRWYLGAALYEAGEFGEALQVLLDSVRRLQDGFNDHSPLPAQAYLAMTRRKLGAVGDARADLLAFETGFRSYAPPTPILAELLRQRAWPLIEGKNPPPLRRSPVPAPVTR